MLKCVSYLRVPQQKEKDKEENIEFSILKFQIWYDLYIITNIIPK